MIVRSVPSRSTRASSRWNGVSLVVTTGVFSRARRMYAAPTEAARAAVAFSASMLSHGTTTRIFGRTRIKAMSSSIWCVAPSGPTETPACEPAIHMDGFAKEFPERFVEVGVTRHKGDLAGQCQPGRHRDQILLGHADLDETLGKFFGKAVHVRRFGQIRAHRHDALVPAAGRNETAAETGSDRLLLDVLLIQLRVEMRFPH